MIDKFDKLHLEVYIQNYEPENFLSAKLIKMINIRNLLRMEISSTAIKYLFTVFVSKGSPMADYCPCFKYSYLYE